MILLFRVNILIFVMAGTYVDKICCYISLPSCSVSDNMSFMHVRFSAAASHAPVSLLVFTQQLLYFL